MAVDETLTVEAAFEIVDQEEARHQERDAAWKAAQSGGSAGDEAGAHEEGMPSVQSMVRLRRRGASIALQEARYDAGHAVIDDPDMETREKIARIATLEVPASDREARVADVLSELSLLSSALSEPGLNIFTGSERIATMVRTDQKGVNYNFVRGRKATQDPSLTPWVEIPKVQIGVSGTGATLSERHHNLTFEVHTSPGFHVLGEYGPGYEMPSPSRADSAAAFVVGQEAYDEMNAKSPYWLTPERLFLLSAFAGVRIGLENPLSDSVKQSLINDMSEAIDLQSRGIEGASSEPIRFHNSAAAKTLRYLDLSRQKPEVFQRVCEAVGISVDEVEILVRRKHHQTRQNILSHVITGEDVSSLWHGLQIAREGGLNAVMRGVRATQTEV